MKRQPVGSGITQKEVVRIESGEDAAQYNPQYNRWRKEQGDRIQQIQTRCEQVLTALELPTDPLAYFERPALPVQSPEWYAVEILNRLRRMHGTQEQKRLREAVCHAIEAGLLWKEAEMKFRWEDDVLTRHQHRNTRRGNAKKGAQANRRDGEHERWRDAAQTITRERADKKQPALKKADLARRVKRRLRLEESVETIRKRL